MTSLFSNIQQVTNFFDERKSLGIQLGLDRITKLLNALDNPQLNINAIHIAGTNGKGSTINFMSSALIANHYNVGVFTSPSLDGLTGHILHNGKKISDNQLLSIFNKVYPVVQTLDKAGVYPTEFEIITAIALLFFVDNVDIALIEAGMGGRYDTTNCLKPMLSMITNVAKDHSDFLGKTIEEIAIHKAGIIKSHTPVVVGSVSEDALSIIENEANQKEAPLLLLQKDFLFNGMEQNVLSQSFLWEYKDIQIPINLSMLGEHQIHNSSLALMALQLLKESGFKLKCAEVIKGISTTKLAGRFEIIEKNGQTIILDGAHNIAGIKSFIKTVESNYKDIQNKKVIFAAFKDKEYNEMLYELLPYFSEIILTTFAHPRAIPAQQLKTIANQINESVHVQDVDRIIHQINHANDYNDTYFFTGSLHFISYIRKQLLY